MRQTDLTKLARDCVQIQASDQESSFSTLHLLEKILSKPDCNAHKALVEHGLNTAKLLEALSGFSEGEPSVEPAMRSTLEKAYELAEEIKGEKVGTDHLLLALLETDTSRGGLVLRKVGLSGEQLGQSVRRMEREA